MSQISDQLRALIKVMEAESEQVGNELRIARQELAVSSYRSYRKQARFNHFFTWFWIVYLIGVVVMLVHNVITQDWVGIWLDVAYIGLGMFNISLHWRRHDQVREKATEYLADIERDPLGRVLEVPDGD